VPLLLPGLQPFERASTEHQASLRGRAGLSSPQVALNGKELSMVDPHGDAPALPPLPAVAKTGAAITVPGLSFGFFVLRG